MAIRILKIARVAAPERLTGGLLDVCTGPRGRRNHFIYRLRALDVVSQAALGRTRRRDGETSIVRKVGPRPKCKTQPGLQVEEGDCAMRKLFSDNALGGPSESVAVECDGAWKIVDAEREYGEARLHDGRQIVNKGLL